MVYSVRRAGKCAEQWRIGYYLKSLYEGVSVRCTSCIVWGRGMKSIERMKVNVPYMKCLRNLVVATPMKRVRKEEVRRRTGIDWELGRSVNPRVLRWFGFTEKKNEYRISRMLMSEASGVRVWTKPSLGWMGDVMVALGSTVMTEYCGTMVKDRYERRALMLKQTILKDVPIFLGLFEFVVQN